MNSKRLGVLIITPVILFILFLTSCGNTIELEVATSAELTATVTNDFPIGEFYMPILDDYRASFVGNWFVDGVYFNFNDDGTFTVTDTIGVQRMSGTYRIDGELYTETGTDMKTCQIAGPATYRWSFRDEILIFIDVGDDECNIRKSLMYDRPIFKQE